MNSFKFPDFHNPIYKKKSKNAFSLILKYFFLIAIGYIVLFQIFYMISYAFRPESEMTDPSVVWVPKEFTLLNFKNAIKALDYGNSLFTTLTVLIVSAFAEVASCAVVAYGFARFKFPFKNFFFFLVILTIAVPSQMLAIPMYLNYAYFDVFGLLKLIGKAAGHELRPNLLGTGFVFWLPSLFASGLRSGLFIFIYRQFYVGLPKELEEAAAIDGAGPVKTFTSIIVPSSGVAILTVAIFSIVWHWNECDLSSLYYNDHYPLSVMLSFMSSKLEGVANDSRGIRMAACLVFVLPILIMYALLQKKFIQSIDRVGIVG